jgi:hypothetical protein
MTEKCIKRAVVFATSAWRATYNGTLGDFSAKARGGALRPYRTEHSALRLTIVVRRYQSYVRNAVPNGNDGRRNRTPNRDSGGADSPFPVRSPEHSGTGDSHSLERRNTPAAQRKDTRGNNRAPAPSATRGGGGRHDSDHPNPLTRASGAPYSDQSSTRKFQIEFVFSLPMPPLAYLSWAQGSLVHALPCVSTRNTHQACRRVSCPVT